MPKEYEELLTHWFPAFCCQKIVSIT